MTGYEWTMIGAVLVAPVLAVQAQKWIERARARRQGRLGVFQTLMATRAARASAAHVQALNMIDLEFYGKASVIDAWSLYRDHLFVPPPVPEALPSWAQRGEELFVDLLHEMTKELRFQFGKVQLRRGIYAPQAHADLENDLRLVRQSLVRVLSGQDAIPVRLVEVEALSDPGAGGQRVGPTSEPSSERAAGDGPPKAKSRRAKGERPHE